MLAASSSSVLAALAAGLGLCLSLIIAPGAQNVFLLRMGVQRRHAVALAITCLVSDAVLFTAGVAGFGVVVEHLPWLFELVRWAGVVFLAVYGLSAAWRALRPEHASIRIEEDAPDAPSPTADDAADAPSGSGGTATLTRPARTTRTGTGTLLPAILSCLAITWLNPHAYLDTVFLVGSVSASYGDLRWAFGLGAILGSAIWFSFLTVAARFAARRLRSPRAWRILDGLIAVAMLALAAGLAFS
ncbi:LysE/ArgO family amino acid transporter [Microbacterium sp. Root53]|uniref:LysE/ArgO family amino acid transporter n=1 Tax=Microbacterium sp. Root53 TaxID=1736553 RepID=UPI001F29FAB6|nr:LysE family transporter [Microbacterium sp. Root53]